MLPTLFLSHGSPMLALDQSPARTFLEHLAAHFPKPDAIVIASAHFYTGRPIVVGDEDPGMIYDFGGFPRPLYEMVYDAPGDPVLATKVAGLIHAAGLAVGIAPERGYDHGTWIPLKLAYPAADIPVVQISVQPAAGPAHHLALGKALSSLPAENILVIGSGSLTHNLHEIFRGPGGMRQLRAPVLPWVKSFSDWVNEKVQKGAVDDLVNYRKKAPVAVENHPTDEHFLPFFVALGAAGAGAKGELMHSSPDYGALMMDMYAFHPVETPATAAA